MINEYEEFQGLVFYLTMKNKGGAKDNYCSDIRERIIQRA